MLTREQVDFYNENGFLRVPEMFNKTEIDELSDELDRLVQEWAFTSEGWTGPWRQAYMDKDTEKKSKLTAMHDLQFYSMPWLRAVTHPRLVSAPIQMTEWYSSAHRLVPRDAPIPECDLDKYFLTVT